MNGPMYAQPTRINMNAQGYGTAEYGSDANMVVLFMTKSVEDIVQSREQGMPVFKNEIYVKMHPVGELLNIIERPATRDDQARFPRQFQSFALNKTQVPDGTPIDLLFPNNPALSDTMKARGIYTIQQLASMSAHAIDSFGIGGQDYVNKAQNYIKNATGAVGFHQNQTEIETNKREIATLKRIVEDQKKQIDDLVRMVQNPNSASLSPSFQPNYDAQAERINANHTTTQIIQEAAKPVVESAMQVKKPLKMPDIPTVDIQEHRQMQDGLPDLDLDISL